MIYVLYCAGEYGHEGERIATTDRAQVPAMLEYAIRKNWFPTGQAGAAREALAALLIKDDATLAQADAEWLCLSWGGPYLMVVELEVWQRATS